MWNGLRVSGMHGTSMGNTCLVMDEPGDISAANMYSTSLLCIHLMTSSSLKITVNPSLQSFATSMIVMSLGGGGSVINIL